MRTWERARIDDRCGRCNRHVQAEQPVLVIVLTTVNPAAARRIRCTECAGEASDQAQLDAVDEQAERAAIVSDGAPTPYEFTGVTKPLRFDAKAAQAGRDDA